MSRSLTAPSTSVYMPSMTRMNDPEIPGRIMAQIAIAPTRKKIHSGCVTTSAVPSATSVSSRSPSRKNNATVTPTAMPTATASTLLRRLYAIQIVPTTSPKNSPAMVTGWSFSSDSRIDDSAATAIRTPASNVTSQTHSMSETVCLNPVMSPVRSCFRPRAPVRMLRISRS